jgi:microcystin-dependent protein
MFTGSIKISELDALGLVIGRDFFPVVQSGSLTTFRVSITTLNEYFRVSGSTLSASWASHSLDADRSVSASWASSSLNSLRTVSASWASHSLDSDRTVSASFASASISSSYSLSSTSASYALAALSASFAPFDQAFQVSASYALTASYAPTIGDTVPVGTIMAFASTTVPNNWLECNGAALSTASFSDLYAAIQNNDGTASFGFLADQFGNRNSSGGYFKIPDFRGEFLRGWDHNRGIDLNRIFATLQTASLGTHYHGVGTFDSSGNDDGFFVLRSWSDGVARAARQITGDSDSNNTITIGAGGPSPSLAIGTSNAILSSGDVRPRNVAIMYCIKYSNATNFAESGATIAGDVIGTLSASTVVKLQNIPITSSAPTHGDILQYSSASNTWHPASATANGVPGFSYMIANPGGVFGNGSDLYVYNYNRHSTRRNLVKIDTVTNEATYQIQWPIDIWKLYGRIFRKTTDGLLHIMLFSDDNLWDYDITNQSATRITGSGGFYFDLPVKVSWASGSLRPTTWALIGSYNAGGDGDTPNLRWRKHYWNGASWIQQFSTTTVDIRLIQNNTEFLKFYNTATNPAAATNTLLWDYNYIKKRYYLLDTGTGYLHIFSQDTGDIDTNFTNADISYIKTLAVPCPHLDDWSDVDAEKMVVDYHPDTGDERGICMTRRGNNNLVGNVAYIFWPEV